MQCVIYNAIVPYTGVLAVFIQIVKKGAICLDVKNRLGTYLNG